MSDKKLVAPRSVYGPELKRFARGAVAAAGLTLLGTLGLSAQEENAAWEAKTELSFVQTGGNASASTLGLANVLTRDWGTTQFKLDFGGVRTETTRFTRTANGTADNFSINESSTSEVSAENYFARTRLDRKISDRTSVFGQTGWLRNTFAGLDNRFVTVAGLANQWIDTDQQKLRTGYGVTFTKQDDVVPNPDVSDTFVGAQLTSEFWRQLTETAEWTSTLVVDGNADDTSDIRADWVNALGVSMSDRLALKTTLQLLFDNQPSLVGVPLVGPGGADAGTVLVPLDEFDRVFTVALVVSF